MPRRRQHKGDPMSPPVVTTSAKSWALKLAALSVPFDAAALVAAAKCAPVTAQTVLGKLAAEGVIKRVAHGWYAAHGVIPEHTPKPGGPVAMARGVQEARARELAAAEAWLATKEPLPAARPPAYVERGHRRAL
jgi:hypothetical protein